jgi:hypothetical protein
VLVGVGVIVGVGVVVAVCALTLQKATNPLLVTILSE